MDTDRPTTTTVMVGERSQKKQRLRSFDDLDKRTAFVVTA
jgi:hypothetical protein